MEISYSVNQDIALLTHSLIPGLQAVFRKPGHLHRGASGMTEWLPSPPKTGPGSQLFRTKAFKGSMPQIHMLIRDVILYLQCEHFYLITCLDNLSDARLIPLVLDFPPKIALGFFLSVFYFLAPKIMKLTRGAREYPQKISLPILYCVAVWGLSVLLFQVGYFLHCMSHSHQPKMWCVFKLMHLELLLFPQARFGSSHSFMHLSQLPPPHSEITAWSDPIRGSRNVG